jgi:hypothetical protein
MLFAPKSWKAGYQAAKGILRITLDFIDLI